MYNTEKSFYRFYSYMADHPPKTDRELIKVNAGDIRLGMYMAYADRPWLETPFLFQGFLLDNEKLLDAVKDECEFIYIDKGKSLHKQPPKTPVKKPARNPAEKSLMSPADKKVIRSAKPDRYQTTRPIEEVFDSAVKKHKASLGAIKDILREIRTGEGINVTNVRRSVKACVASIVENPNAMLWLSRLRNRDEYTAEHCLNVGILAIAMGRHLGLDEKALEIVGLCGMLHDVGKMQVDPAVLNKPGRLTEEEFAIIKTHCQIGKSILEGDSDIPKEAIEAAWGHHERIDGGGYPRGAKASNLSLYTRIISIVDTYDAITTNRCYDNSRPASEAIKILFSCRDSQFDGWLVEEFIGCLGIYPTGSLVELRSGEGAVVIDSNKNSRLHPKVTIVLDEHKRSRQPLIVDTRDYQEHPGGRTIKSVLDENEYKIDLEYVFSHFRN
ncbi:MAG: HD-GYP domain-containing protein [Gammaproteobacteria bacterium]|nr:HD-GYP domain-containing protein [Pseudomonadales bacterium]MCP5346981.1 HD-GYP domain-containing protein [Pseudomonadales bacterium]